MIVLERAELRRAAADTCARRHGLHEHVLREDAHVRVGLERHAPREHLVHDDAERVDVGAVIDRLPLACSGDM